LHPQKKQLNFIHKQMKKTLFSVVVLAMALVMGTMMSCQKEEEVPAMTAEELNAQIENLVDSNVVVEGIVAHICQCDGMKMKFEGADIKFVWDSVFDAALMGQKLRIEGTVCEERMDSNAINEFEAKVIAKMQEDSIAAAAAAAEAPVAEAKPAECEKKCEGKCEHAEGEKHECCGHHAEGEEPCCPMKRIAMMREELAANLEQGIDYIVVDRYVKVTKVTPVVEEAK